MAILEPQPILVWSVASPDGVDRHVPVRTMLVAEIEEHQRCVLGQDTARSEPGGLVDVGRDGLSRFHTS